MSHYLIKVRVINNYGVDADTSHKQHWRRAFKPSSQDCQALSQIECFRVEFVLPLSEPTFDMEELRGFIRGQTDLDAGIMAAKRWVTIGYWRSRTWLKRVLEQKLYRLELLREHGVSTRYHHSQQVDLEDELKKNE